MSLLALTNVFYNSQADGSARLVLLAIADCADDQGIAWPSLPTLALKAHISKQTARRQIAELMALGELEVVRKGNGRQSTVYRVIFQQNSTRSRGTKMVPLAKSPQSKQVHGTPEVSQLRTPSDTRAEIPELPYNDQEPVLPPSSPPIPISNTSSKLASGNKNTLNSPLIGRINALFKRPAHLPLTQPETRALRRLGIISSEDLAVIETVNGLKLATSTSWWPRTPKFLFQHWPLIVAECRKILASQSSPSVTKEPDWQSELEAVKQMIGHYPDTSGIDRLRCGFCLNHPDLPPEKLTELFFTLTPEQAGYLADIKKEYYEKLIRIRSARRAKHLPHQS